MRNADKFMDKWGKERKKGKVKYILINSVIYCIFYWIVISIIYLLKGKGLDRLLESLDGFIIFAIVYILCLFRIWKKNEERYINNL